MNPQVKEKWIAALRSGKYEQGFEVLTEVNDNGTSFSEIADLIEENF
jgi:hypothetical protein